MNRYVDARGKQCPVPLVMAKQAISEMGTGTVTVIVDNEISAQNLKKMAVQKNYSVSDRQIDENHYEVEMTVKGATAKAETKERDCPVCVPADRTVIAAIGSDKMGEGDEALGRVLMKGFIYALSRMDQMPGAVIFYNSGARLTCEGSDSLEDLRIMEEQGVSVYTCGTCLNHYELEEKLAVGSVTNMYVIAETMAQAGKVLRP